MDITGFNANVAFELGLAHGQGKPTLMVVRGTDGKAGVFPDIAKLQVRPYPDDVELVALIARFVASAPDARGAAYSRSVGQS